MGELESKIIQESKVFKQENTDRKEIGYFIYDKYIVSVYRLYSIMENNQEEGSFENVYVVYDTKTGEIFDEYSQDNNSVFEALPQIDGVQFASNYEDVESVEKYKKQVKEAVMDYYKTGIMSSNYKKALEEIVKYVDKSSLDFYKFYIENV